MAVSPEIINPLQAQALRSHHLVVWFSWFENCPGAELQSVFRCPRWTNNFGISCVRNDRPVPHCGSFTDPLSHIHELRVHHCRLDFSTRPEVFHHLDSQRMTYSWGYFNSKTAFHSLYPKWRTPAKAISLSQAACKSLTCSHPSALICWTRSS